VEEKSLVKKKTPGNPGKEKASTETGEKGGKVLKREEKKNKTGGGGLEITREHSTGVRK